MFGVPGINEIRRKPPNDPSQMDRVEWMLEPAAICIRPHTNSRSFSSVGIPQNRSVCGRRSMNAQWLRCHQFSLTYSHSLTQLTKLGFGPSIPLIRRLCSTTTNAFSMLCPKWPDSFSTDTTSHTKHLHHACESATPNIDNDDVRSAMCATHITHTHCSSS